MFVVECFFFFFLLFLCGDFWVVCGRFELQTLDFGSGGFLWGFPFNLPYLNFVSEAFLLLLLAILY